MNNRIHVMSNELQIEINNLSTLKAEVLNNDKLNEAINKLDISSGEMAESINEINSSVKDIAGSFGELINLTVEFLNNANTTFSETDANIANTLK